MEYKNFNDYELLYRIRENDETSYNELFQKYSPVIKKMAIDFYKSFNSYGYDFDDFVQEGYLGFQNAVEAFDESRDVLFYTFVTLCIHRSILSFCKRITCESKNISNHNFVNLDDVPIADEVPSMEEYFSNQELLKELWDVAYSFPLEYSCVFELRMNCFQYNEIAELLDITIRRARLMYQRIQKRIQRDINFLS